MTDARVPAAPPDALDARRVLFVTGRLAEPALRRVLGGMTRSFDAEVAVLPITVAALMTTDWIAFAQSLTERPVKGMQVATHPGSHRAGRDDGTAQLVLHELGLDR